MTHTLTPSLSMESGLPRAIPTHNTGSIACLRQSFDGSRSLCLMPLHNESRLGDCTPVGPELEQALAPLVARFAALVFAEQDAASEPFVQQLRWIAFEHGIDHIVLPLWPETGLARRIEAMAIDLGMPANFILMQDEATWPCALHYDGLESMASHDSGPLRA